MTAKNSTQPGRDEEQHARHERPGKRRSAWPWILAGIAVLIVAATALAPTIVRALTVSVDAETRQTDIGAVELTVPAEWVLERPLFSDEVRLHSPDGQLAMCFEAVDAPGSAEALRGLAEALAIPADHITTETSPSGSEVAHVLGASSEQPCAAHPVTMIAAIDASAGEANAVLTVRIGSTEDVAPYLGEIADVLNGVSAP